MSSGATVELGRVDEASWSPDGTRVHVVRQGRGCVPSLRTVTTGGSLVSTVTSGLKSEDRSFTWSPDQRSVAFLRFHSGPPEGMCGSQGGSYSSADLRTDLVVMADDGTARRILVPGGWPWKLAWSPDGTRIAFLEWDPPLDEAIGRLSIVDVATGAIRHLTGTLELPDQVAWSPDGTEIRLRSIDALGEARHVASVHPDSGAMRELFIASSRTHELAWSPDGRLAAAAVDIVAADGALSGADLNVWDLGTAANVTLEVGNLHAYVEPPVWSPDGTWLAFTTSGGVDIVTVDGADRRHVPASTDFEVAAWQPR